MYSHKNSTATFKITTQKKPLHKNAKAKTKTKYNILTNFQ